MPVSMGPTDLTATSGPSAPRPPIYGTRETLEKLATVFKGDIWPELAAWESEEPVNSTGVVLTP